MLLSPLYIYLLAGVISGWIGGRITAPAGLNDWKPQEHQVLMITCKKMCGNKPAAYEPLTGDCTCRRPSKSHD